MNTPTKLFINALLISFAVFAGSPDANVLLDQAEKIRNPQQDYEMNALIKDTKKGKTETHTYKNQLKGRSKALIHFLTPEVDRGTKVLMVEDQMWVYMPTTAKPIRVSAKQRLLGNASYGDIVRLNFTGNYTAKLKGEETFKGRKAYVLELASIDGKPVTYDRVDYWIDKETKSPLKALYMTIGGKILREGYFAKFEKFLGGRHPMEFTLIDYIEKNHVTKLLFSKPKKANLPDLLFEKQNFGRG